ncbi:MAG: DUF2628 domain-containing protein [Gammaproteobacteria bacterium]
MRTITFHNKQTDVTIVAREYPWLWALLFGPFYFMLHGIWTHVAIWLGTALITGLLSGLVYPFFARSVLMSHYTKLGYKVTMTGAPVEPERKQLEIHKDMRGAKWGS